MQNGQNDNYKINQTSNDTQLPEAPDYTKSECWKLLPKNGDKPVDTFFVCPTLTLASEYGDFASIEEMRAPAGEVAASMSSAFADDTNVYMPLYRQVAFSKAAKMNKDGMAYAELVKDNVTYSDVAEALDYYFEHYNNGKPFILAGHSQGSCISFLLLEDYFKKQHPDYLKRMVAAYPIGWARDKAYYENNHLQFAEGESDVGVIVSWNTIGPDAVEDTIVLPKNAVAINPLNWKLDDTYAGPEENKGSLIDGKIVMNYADAKVNLQRGYIECNTQMEYLVFDPVLGDKCLHNGDYALYFNNIKENASKRIAAYFNK